MKLWFLPFVREGVTPVAAASTATARPQTRITMRLAAPGRQARDIGRSLELLGPGDVIGIDPSQVLRADTRAGFARCRTGLLPVGGVRRARAAVDVQPGAARGNAPAAVDRAGGDRSAAGRARGPWPARPESVDPAHACGRGTSRIARPRRCLGVGARAGRLCDRGPDRDDAGERTRSHAGAPVVAAQAAPESRLSRLRRAHVPRGPAGGSRRQPRDQSVGAHRPRTGVECHRHARRVTGLSHVVFPHRRGRRFRIARAASAADTARCIDSGATDADRDAGRARGRLGTAAARARQHDATIEATHGGRVGDPQGAQGRHRNGARARTVVRGLVVDRRADSRPDHGLGAGIEPDADVARGCRPRGRSGSRRAGGPGRGGLGTVRRVPPRAKRRPPQAVRGHRGQSREGPARQGAGRPRACACSLR